MKGYLLLSDGTKFQGTIIGAAQNTIGEIVFNTGMTGYQEIVTDPSYYGQIVVLTYPMIGNYGISKGVEQSERIQVKGLVIRSYDQKGSHWESENDLVQYLKENKMVCISGVDTRALTKHIRNHGTLTAQIIVDDVKAEWETFKNVKPCYHVSTEVPYEIGSGKYHVAVMDFGIKKNIINQLLKRDFRLTVFPAHTLAKDIANVSPDGIFLSNGPGNPEELNDIITEVKSLMNYPMFGICLGHQLIGCASGVGVEKLKYGHRGPNHPVKDIVLDRVFITSQNHSYILKKDTIDLDTFDITHYSVNDMSVEGIKHKSKPIFSVQYHPEASPGPDDSNYLFEAFETMIKEVTVC